MRVHPEPIEALRAPRVTPPQPETRPMLLAVVDAADASNYRSGQFTSVLAHTTADAVRAINMGRPRVVAVDWDLPNLDASAVCSAASAVTASVLVTTSREAIAPAALKAGCHAILLKPFAINLLAARVGRLLRERGYQSLYAKSVLKDYQGTNRTWADVACPHCTTRGAVSFEFASHRRMWFACLACDAVWLGARQE